MSHSIDSLLSSYDYSLDPELIAQVPAEPRHSARLLIVDELHGLSTHRHASVWDMQKEFSPGDLIVLNNTRVMKARLKVRRKGGGIAELLLLEPAGNAQWLCLARPAKKIRPGDELWLEALEQVPIALQVVSKNAETGGIVVQFPSSYMDRETMDKLLERYGEVPLPPYIEPSLSNLDNAERYQTRYAIRPGAVAAPTAGLHLSDELLEALDEQGVMQTRVTLHVGLGTFRPLDKEDLRELRLHSEWVEVNQEVVNAVTECHSRGGRVIAIGTTSVRALEAAFIAGNGKLQPLTGKVDLVIKPGYRFGVVDGLLTNFHLPKSSLLLLVSALIGRQRLLSLYLEAMEKKYRFFSYGDAMLIRPQAVLPEART